MFFGDISNNLSGLVAAALALVAVWLISVEMNYREEVKHHDRKF